MALALPAHQPGVIVGSSLTGGLRNTAIGSGPFTLYLRVRTGGSGLLFECGGLTANGTGAGYNIGGIATSGTSGTVQHLAFVRNGSAALLYLDGVQVASGAFASALGSSYQVGPAGNRIYRVALWNRALAPTEIMPLAAHGPADADRWGSDGTPGCVLDLDFAFGIGRYIPDRTSNLAGASTLGDLLHLLPVSYGLRSVLTNFDFTFDGEDPYRLFDLPPHCGLLGVEFESGSGLAAATVGTLDDPNRFVDGHTVGAGLSYAPSLNLGTQSATEFTEIFLLGAAGSNFKVRCVYEVRGLPTVVPDPDPPDPISVTAVADPDVVAPCETSALTATVLNGDGVSGVTWTIVSGPGTLSDITPFTATYNAPCPYTSDAIVILKATSVEDPSKSFEFPMSVDYTPPDPPVITGVVIGADPIEIALDGGTSLITAFVTGTGDFDAGLSWSIVGGTGTGSLSFDTVLTRILDGLTIGTVTVRATSTGDPSKWAEVTVLVSVPALSVLITGNTNLNINTLDGGTGGMGEPNTFDHYALLNGIVTGAVSDSNVTWSIISGPGIMGSAGPNTLEYFYSLSLPGTTVVRATSVEDPGAFDNHSITVAPVCTLVSFDIITFKFTSSDYPSTELFYEWVGKFYCDDVGPIMSADSPLGGFPTTMMSAYIGAGSGYVAVENQLHNAEPWGNPHWAFSGNTIVKGNNGIPWDIPPGEPAPGPVTLPSSTGWQCTQVSSYNIVVPSDGDFHRVRYSTIYGGDCNPDFST